METILVARIEPGDICSNWFDLTTMPHPELLDGEIQNNINLKSRNKTHTSESRV